MKWFFRPELAHVLSSIQRETASFSRALPGGTNALVPAPGHTGNRLRSCSSAMERRGRREKEEVTPKPWSYTHITGFGNSNAGLQDLYL